MKNLFTLLLCSATLTFGLTVVGDALTTQWPQGQERMPIVLAITADTNTIIEKRDAIQVMYLLDISENFSGTPQLETAGGGKKILAGLRNGDLFGLIVYSEFARTLIPMTIITDESRQQMNNIMDKIPAETGRNLSRAFTRALQELTPQLGRKTQGRFIVYTLLGPMSSGSTGKELIQEIKAVADSTDGRVYNVAYNDRERPFDEELTLTTAQQNNGRAYFARYDTPAQLGRLFSRVAFEIANQHTLDIEISILNNENLKLYSYGSDTPLPERFSFKGLALGQTRFIFLEAGPRPQEAVDLDIDYTFYDIARYATLTEHSAAILQLGRTDASTYNPAAAAAILGHQILVKLAETLPRIERGDNEYRKAYASEYRRMLVSKLNPIRAEIATDRMDAMYNNLMSIYDILTGGTTSNDLAIKSALYQLFDSDYHYLLGDIK